MAEKKINPPAFDAVVGIAPEDPERMTAEEALEKIAREFGHPREPATVTE